MSIIFLFTPKLIQNEREIYGILDFIGGIGRRMSAYTSKKKPDEICIIL